MRGACVVQLSFRPSVDNSEDLKRAQDFVFGQECTVFNVQTCPRPDVNRTIRDKRSALLQDFEVVHLVEASLQGYDSGECPNRYKCHVLVRSLRCCDFCNAMYVYQCACATCYTVHMCIYTVTVKSMCDHYDALYIRSVCICTYVHLLFLSSPCAIIAMLCDHCYAM